MAKDKNYDDFSYTDAANQSANINSQHNTDSDLNQENLIKDKKDKQDNRLEKYKDPSGVSWRQMRFGLWFSENRRNLTRALTIFLILLSAAFFTYSSYAYIIYFLSGPIDNQPENQVLSPRNFINDMEVGALEIFKNNTSYDVAVRLINSNDNFSAEFNYCLYQNEIELLCGRSFILPSEDKYLLALGLNLNDNLPVSFKVNDIFWSRVNRRDIPDWESFKNERINFATANIDFLNASRSGLSENIRLNRLEFELINNSPYGYFEVPFNIFFYNGSILVGVEKHIAKDFIAGENRLVKMSWPGDLGSVNRIEFVPYLNILKNEVYLKYGQIIK